MKHCFYLEFAVTATCKIATQSKICHLFSSQGGIQESGTKAGLQLPFEIRLARKEMTKSGPTMYSINTDVQLQLELPQITITISNTQP